MIPPAPIRVLVADDSATVRRRLAAALARDESFAIVGEAADGRRAVELCQRLRPDVIALDLVMPEMSGLEATEQIMARCPTPILIVSAAENRGEAWKTLDAIAAGAVASIEKPGATDDDDAWDAELRKSLRLVAGVRVITHVRASLRAKIAATAPVTLDANRPELVAMAASTGGPGAVAEILHALPVGFPLPIALVIHIGATFGSSLAAWLDHQSSLRVVLAEDGTPLPPPGAPARVFLAPPDRHLVLERGLFRLTGAPERHSCRPSADVLFESVARELSSRAIGCLLTGMGRDGAEGLLAMRRAGAHTIAQDEASCTVFGMPREAIALGAAHHVVSLRDIAGRLQEHAAPLTSPGKAT